MCQTGLGCGYVFAAMLKHLVAEFEWSRAAYAASTAPLLLAFALASPLVGALSERLGPRRVLSVSTLLLGGVLLAIGQMQSLWQYYALTLLLGVALTGLGDIPVGAVATRWFDRGRGLALGVVYLGSNLGGAVVPVVAAAIAAQGSWRTAIGAVGLGAWVVILPFALFAVRMPRGDEAGASQDGAGTEGGADDMVLREALRTRSFWILALALLAFYFYYMGVNQHLIAFLSDSGYSDAEAAARFGGAIALGVVAKLAIGALADVIPRLRALWLNFALLTFASLLLLVVERPGVLLVFLAAHGFATAAENVLLPLIVAECFGVRHMARIYGALMLTLFPGGVLGPVFAGHVFDRLGDYRLAFVVFAALNLVALVLLAFVRTERPAR